MARKHLMVFVSAVLLIFTLQACGGGGGSTPTGAAQVSLTDAPGDFDHVWITVKDIWFHASDTAGPYDAGWRTFPLPAPATVDLLTLANGVVGNPVWGNISLPAGTYQQIRLVLAATEDSLTASAKAVPLTYNNEVRIAGGEFPLLIPDAARGIKLTGTFQITNGGTLRLAVDFDAGHDVIDLGNGEYVLKPRLAYFDLDDAGAIVGQINLASAPPSTVHFVVKAEAPSDNGTYHVVKRYTVVNLASAGTGTFVLYPVSAITATAYDLVIRGIGYETTIIKGVPVSGNTTPMVNPTTVPVISMVTGTDYAASGSITSPTGAWANFYQTLDSSATGTTEVPYEIRFRHFHPLIGSFSGFRLSNSQLQYAMYNSSSISTVAVTPAETIGGYQASAGAILYNRSALPGSGSPNISSSSPTVTFSTPLTPKSGIANTVSGTIDMSRISSSNMSKMTKGYVFAVHGGMIVNSVDVGGTMSTMMNGPYTIPNLPGGFPGAFYGVEAIGWDPSDFTIRAIAFPPELANLSSGTDATGVTMNMIAF